MPEFGVVSVPAVPCAAAMPADDNRVIAASVQIWNRLVMRGSGAGVS
jgi:hypothetical protein